MAGLATATVRAAKGRRLIPTRAALVLVSVVKVVMVCWCGGRSKEIRPSSPHHYKSGHIQDDLLHLLVSGVVSLGV